MVVVDGHFIAFRALHSGVSLEAPDGSPTGILQIFISVMMKLRTEFPNKTVEIVFDAKGPTHRHKLLESYKSTRKPTPEELITQVEILKEQLPFFGFNVYAIEGFEADDTIFTLVNNSKTGAVIISKDKDLMQLIDDNPQRRIYMYDYQKGVEVDEEGVEEKLGVQPNQVRDFLALAGDASDNIPGVPSVGPKTASKLLNEYGDIDGIYLNINKIKGKLQTTLKDNKDLAYLSQELTELKHVDNLQPTAHTAPDNNRAGMFLSNYGLRGLLRKHFPEYSNTATHATHATEATEATEATAGTPSEGTTRHATTFTHGIIDTGEGHHGDYLFYVEGTVYIVQNSICQRVIDSRVIDSEVGNSSLEGGDVFNMGVFMGTDDVYDAHDANATGNANSTVNSNSTANGNANSTANSNSTDDGNANSTANTHTPPITATQAITLLRNAPAGHVLFYNYKGLLQSKLFTDYLRTFADADADADADSGGMLDMMLLLWMNNTDGKSHLRLKGETDLEFMARISDLYEASKGNMGITAGLESYKGVDVKVLPILVAMEERGICVDSRQIRKAADDISARIRELEAEICDYVGYRFNLASTKQLAEALFSSLGIVPHKKIKTGFSTNEESLRAVLRNNPQHADLLNNILEYRELSKLLSTYTIKLLDFVDDGGRMHPEYNITGAATGRISANNPNIQSIPVRGSYSDRIRGSFRATTGYKLVGIDYSQVELRILAHLCGDEKLVEAFTQDEDIHAKTAMNIFHQGDAEATITPAERRIAKEVNFSVIYGKTAFGLSQSLEIPMGEASTFINGYFKLYGGVKRYIDKTIEDAVQNGYTTTILGRIRTIHNIGGANNMQLAHAKRSAVNAPIQGSAADIIKLAMIRADDYITKNNVEAHMIMQIHDELVFEVEESIAESFSQIMKEIMVSVINLKVPLKVNASIGDNWSELK